MKTTLAIIAAFVLSPSICVASENPDINSVKTVLEKYETAMQEGDVGAVSELFSHDPDVVVINAWKSKRVIGWKSIEDHYKQLFSGIQDAENATEEFKLIHSDLVVKLFASGNAAVLVCRQDFQGKREGKTYTWGDFRTTWVLEKQDGQWRIVNAHWSVGTERDESAEE